MEQEKPENQDCLKEALGQGLISGLKASAVAGALYHLAWKNSHFFRNQFNVSARTALLAMPIFYTTYLNVELSMHDCKRRSEPEYVVVQD
ncbi:hypothetical protein DUNSADRAFT_17331 [Dunaliella salina]|uniref:Encoded protein n=1 Tax=Dunaliella salina TaxID=3046 RepID=A0ABQ7G1Z5_DUNSA|nr:hypothetical protein DUNSADRAFT_17331 [Dunaliella salina]|eukprot:KAF5828605.1 hypothetical protein DUNSADRAFT_17331 [Dunaliella salina]